MSSGFNKYFFNDIVSSDKGFLRGPFGGDLKKEIFVPKGVNTYKVYEQGVVLRKNHKIGRYHITDEYFNEKMFRFEVKPKDFLVSCSGANYGAIFQMPDNIERGVINQALLRIRLNNKLIDDKYFYYFFSHHLVNQIIGKKGDSTIPNFPPVSVLKKLEIQIHSSTDNQKAIAKVLSDLDAKIELNNKINIELEAMAKLIYDYWIVQIDFADENGKTYKSSGGKMVYNEELKREIPEGWDVKDINEIIEVKDGTHDSPKSQDSGFKLITSKHLKTEGLDFKKANNISEEDYNNINKRSQVNTGDILFSMIGNIGTVYKIEEVNIDFAIKNIALYKTSVHFEMRNYVYMYLRGYDTQRYMGNVISGSIQKFIGLGSLRKMPLMNDSDTIFKFEEKTKFIFKEMNVLKVQNQKLSELRDWLLPMLMNGQVKVK